MTKNRICQLLGIKHPILQGGMVWVSTRELAAAVCNAGGLGVARGSQSKEHLKEDIQAIRDLTDGPLGVNIPLLDPLSAEILEMVAELKVDAVITSAGSPAKHTGWLKEAGLKVLHVIPSVRLAKKAADSGVDAVVAEGYEAGGHNGVDEITTMALIPQVVDAVDIPVVAAGGIADARGMVAAFALGAEAVQLGTRFIATRECIAHARVKEAILSAGDVSTVITGRGHAPVRMLKNKLAEKILEREHSGASHEELLEFIGSGRTRAALIEGDLEEGSLMAGQIAGMIKDVKSVQEVIDEMIQGASGVLSSIPERLEG
jgi:enoyl-[acyl-carrier protein] reductase II